MNIDRSLPYHHIIDFLDGTSTLGKVDRRDEPKYLGFAVERPLAGKRVLDVGALDEILSFRAERAGAEHVLAVDVEDVEDYDWGFEGLPAPMRTMNARRKKVVFEHFEDVLESRVKREPITVYDLDPVRHGVFDRVFLYGVLYEGIKRRCR